VRTCVVPPGLRPIFYGTQDLRPGLTYGAPPGLASCRFCSTGVTRRVVLVHTLKALRHPETNIFLPAIFRKKAS